MIFFLRQLPSPFLRTLLFFFISHSFCRASDFSEWEPNLIRMLAEGRQAHAENLAGRKLEEASQNLKNLPKNSSQEELRKKELAQAAFWNAVLERSRFSIKKSLFLFSIVVGCDPNSLEAKVASDIIGIELAQNKQTAFYFFNSLLALAEENPKSIPILWLTGIMTRSLTGNYYSYQSSISYPEIFHIQNCGVAHYEKLLKGFYPNPGPVLVHQTLANLLDDLHCNELGLAHRERALEMEHEPWILHGMGKEHLQMGNYQKAIPLFQEAIGKSEGAPPAYYYKDLGSAFWNLKQYENALQAWDRAFAIKPTSISFWPNYTRACRLLEDYPRGWDFVKKILEQYPNDPEAKVVEARMAALCDDPDATAKQKKAGTFKFTGRVVKDNFNSTDPWEIAISYGDTKAFLALVEGRDVNLICSSDQQTPLMTAAQKGWTEILRELIRRGASLDMTDANKDTALHYASQFNSPESVAILVEAGANPNLRDKWQQTPLLMCLDSDNREGARILLANGADPSLSTGHRGAALNYAAGNGEVEMVERMLAKGANPNAATGVLKETPLMVAGGSFHYQSVLPPLLEAGANINASDKNGNTALHRAINPLLNRPMVYFLLDNGAIPSQPNAEGITPITQARLLGYDDIAEKMEKALGAKIPFSFPKIQEAPTNDPTAQAAAAIVTPLLLAQGHPTGVVVSGKNLDKNNARKELAWMFGISNKKQFGDTIDQLLEFHPQIEEASLQIPEIANKEKLLELLVDRAKLSHGNANSTTNEKAWVLAHVIYLADLGVDAEFLEQTEADALIAEMVETTKKSFASWHEFYESFLYGAKRLCGWEHERYNNICRRLEQQNIAWFR